MDAWAPDLNFLGWHALSVASNPFLGLISQVHDQCKWGRESRDTGQQLRGRHPSMLISFTIVNLADNGRKWVNCWNGVYWHIDWLCFHWCWYNWRGHNDRCHWPSENGERRAFFHGGEGIQKAHQKWDSFSCSSRQPWCNLFSSFHIVMWKCLHRVLLNQLINLPSSLAMKNMWKASKVQFQSWWKV